MSCPQLWTSREVAEHCRCTPETVNRWRREHGLRTAGRTPRGYLYAPDDVRAFLRAQDLEARPSPTLSPVQITTMIDAAFEQGRAAS